MAKTDKSKHNISIASIKRCTYKPYDYKLTKFYESNSDFPNSYPKIDLKENELIICSTFIDSKNYSILTTQKLITKENGIKHIGNIIGATDKAYVDFKGYKDDSVTFGLIELEDGTDLKYFIETGKASMIMIYGVRTLIRTEHMTEKNIENTTRNWNRQNEKNKK
ncbi:MULTISPECIES: hypothetical protein [unclassified Cellulophaga]|uniref:hypothetical protein n=1 Tax=unclassified Cellulophaga TaxID=2634405 RepID=UPI0026E1F6AB|nr:MULTISPECIES: hypothetical protein [unclassified Cellulophaga]MDO6492888.1 hypothetical protein [Cellulophaga sp. 2_MG-2023]MDO6496390.1 hypothetical protein [Cellulophaga sp. 3_MG-2023]